MQTLQLLSSSVFTEILRPLVSSVHRHADVLPHGGDLLMVALRPGSTSGAAAAAAAERGAETRTDRLSQQHKHDAVRCSLSRVADSLLGPERRIEGNLLIIQQATLVFFQPNPNANL